MRINVKIALLLSWGRCNIAGAGMLVWWRPACFGCGRQRKTAGFPGDTRDGSSNDARNAKNPPERSAFPIVASVSLSVVCSRRTLSH